MSLVPITGSQCIALVTQASELLKSDPVAAQKQLKTIQDVAPKFVKKLEEKKTELEGKRDGLQREEASLESQINSKEQNKERLRNEIRNLEASKARNEAILVDHQEELRKAERRKSEAESRKAAAITGTVAGGVGAVVLGIFFPPSLAVTVPAVAAAGTDAITEACRAIDRCREAISSVRSSIADENRAISRANSAIYGIERDISELSDRQRNLYDERGRLRNTIVFLQKAVTYFGELRVAVEGGQQRTDLLHRIVVKANEKQNYQILTSRGCRTVVNSFAQAWNQVEDKVMGNTGGYLNIE